MSFGGFTLPVQSEIKAEQECPAVRVVSDDNISLHSFLNGKCMGFCKYTLDILELIHYDCVIKTKQEIGDMKINKGDFIDSRRFSYEECEQFIQLAVECGYTDAEGMRHYNDYIVDVPALGVASSSKGRHVPYKHIGWGQIEDTTYGFSNNISQQFREFLDKENSMNNVPKDATHYGKTSKGNICFYKLEGDTWYFLYADAAEQGGKWCRVGDNFPSHTPLTEIKRQFTKADLLDGMRVTMRCGHEWYVCGKEEMVALEEYLMGLYRDKTFSWSRMTSTLEHDTDNQYDIVKVVDRDNTVVWEREQPKKKVTLELTDEQIAQIKAQFML